MTTDHSSAATQPDPAQDVTITEVIDGEVIDAELDTDTLADEVAAETDQVKAATTGEAESEVEVDAEVLEAEVDAEADADVVDEQADTVAELTEDLQRLNAEYANFRKRVERDRALERDMAKAKVLSGLFPVLDDLHLAAQHGDLNGPLKSVDDKLRGVLTSSGVEAFGEVGDVYDFTLHEAVQDSSTGDDKVLGQVLRQGYRLGDRVLRTAMVLVADA